MHIKAMLCTAGLLGLTLSQAASVLIDNLNTDGDAAYSLFDASGTLLPDVAIENVRIGTFTGGFDAAGAWSSGELGALDSNFMQYGDSTSLLLNTGMSGLLQAYFASSNSAFSGMPIVLWISNSADFTNPLGQHLIFQFSASFDTSATTSQLLTLMPGAGTLLAGEFGNYSHDYGLGGDTLDGFNLVAVVPEPSTYALAIGGALVAFTLLRRRKV